MKNHKYFPHEFRTQIPSDVPSNSLLDGNPELLAIFLSLHQIDVRNGYDFAEDVFLAKALKTLTPEWFEWFIKSLHKITGRTTCSVTVNAHPAGIYSRRQMCIAKESEERDTHFNLFFITDETCDETNYQLLARTQGFEKAEIFKEFSRLMFAEYLRYYTAFLKKKSHNQGDIYTFQTATDSPKSFPCSEALAKHRGWEILNTMSFFATPPAKIPASMKVFCQRLYDLIQRDASPAEIAAYTLELTNLHPFCDGNGHVARVLMNCCLISLDCNPLLLIGEDKKAYYRAIQASATDPAAIVRFINPQITPYIPVAKKIKPASTIIVDEHNQTVFLDQGSTHLLISGEYFQRYLDLKSSFADEPYRAVEEIKVITKEARCYTHQIYENLGAKLVSEKRPDVAQFYFLLAARSVEASDLSDFEKKKALAANYISAAVCARDLLEPDIAFIYASRACCLAQAVESQELLDDIEPILKRLEDIEHCSDLTSMAVAAAMIESMPEPPLYLALKQEADQAFKAGAWSKAIAFYNKALDLCQSELPVWYQKGTAHFKVKDYINAKECFERVLALKPDHVNGNICLSRVMKILNPPNTKIDNAAQILRK